MTLSLIRTLVSYLLWGFLGDRGVFIINSVANVWNDGCSLSVMTLDSSLRRLPLRCLDPAKRLVMNSNDSVYMLFHVLVVLESRVCN
jgi:hypothetical protein